MPDLRLRPGQLNPSDIGVTPAEITRVDVTLRQAGAASDVALDATITGLPTALAPELHDGTGALTLTATYAQTGTKAGSGTAAYVQTVTLAGTGVKAGKGAGTLVAPATLASTAAAARHGTGTLVTPATLTAAGAKIHNIGTVAIARPANIAAAGLRGYIGAADVVAGFPKVAARGSARLNVGAASLATHRAAIDADGTLGVIAHGGIALQLSVALYVRCHLAKQIVGQTHLDRRLALGATVHGVR